MGILYEWVLGFYQSIVIRVNLKIGPVQRLNMGGGVCCMGLAQTQSDLCFPILNIFFE